MELVANDTGFELSNQTQKISFERAESGTALSLSTHVRDGDRWLPLFGTGKPLLSGPSFDLIPTAYEVIENSSLRIAVLLKGHRQNPDYAWDMLVEARNDTPWFRIRVTCHLTTTLTISTPEPTAALWLQQPGDLVAVDQGPISIYGGHSWGNSFPAAYLWADHKEAVVFFNMTPMSWMSAANLRRFLDCRVATIARDGEIGLGLHACSQSGNTLPAGHLVVEFFLLSNMCHRKPTSLEALDKTVKACAALLPSTVPFPENHVPPYELTWKCFAENVIRDLMLEGISWAALPSTWNDGPAFPEHEVTVFYAHSDYAINSSRTIHARTSVLDVWDYATCNNFVAPWSAYLRLHPHTEQAQFLAVKRDNVPQFHDTKANLFRWGAAGVPLTPGLENNMVNGIEMSWENLMFHLETIKIHNTLPPDQFNPALPGRFLMACHGLVKLAHNVNYVFPQWFDAFEKTPMIQLDLPELGKVREPFQAGTYAYIMLEAYALTGQTLWLDEAKRAIAYALTEIDYTEVNRRYSKRINDPLEVPIAETFGNGYAVAAAQRLYLLTGDESFLKYAQDYVNILARMAFWYNDESDAISQDLNNLGLFRAHGGHYGTCPWENIEAYLPLTVFLKHTRSHDGLLLKLFNLQRITSFYYFPPTWTPVVAAPNPELYYHFCQYLPIENFYTLEFGGTHGSMGRCIYMCSPAIWNYLLYEAFAHSSDREVMALNLDLLDGYDYAVEGVERSFIVYNPTDQAREVVLQMSFCLDGNYTIIMGHAGGVRHETHSSTALADGLALKLAPLENMLIRIEHRDASQLKSRIHATKKAQATLAHAYQLLQQVATGRGLTTELGEIKRKFVAAREAYDRQEHEKSAALAQDIVRLLGE